MKQGFTCLTILLALCCSLSAKARPCSCNIQKHRRDYRQARAVFIGKVVTIDRITKVPERWEHDLASGFLGSAVTFLVEKRWKGAETNRIVVLEYYLPACGGFHFRKDETYLVYAFDQELIAYTSCSRTRIFRQQTSDDMELKQLNSRWFRFWASLNPF